MYEYFSLRITKDKMRAYLTVLYDKLTETVTSEAILDFLSKRNVVFGICEEEIKKAVENKNLISNLLVAKGEGPASDKNNFLEYTFERGCSAIPCANSRGAVDFSRLKEPVYVHKGDIICKVKIPENNFKCTDVFGKSFVLSEEDFLPNFGPSIEYNKNDKKIYAAIDGCLDYSEYRIDIMPVKIIKDETAEGDYVGNIVIYSKIKEGSHIRTDGHIIICGDATQSNFEAGGSVVIHGYVRGVGKCTIKSGRDIICRSISKMNLYCRRNICSTYMSACIAKAGSCVIATGDGVIESGRYTAGEAVIANRLGSEKTGELMLNIWDNWYNLENNTGDDEKTQLLECEEELSELREQYMQLEKSLNTLKSMEYVEGANANRANIIRRITLARAQVMHSIAAHKKKIEKISYRVRSKKMEIACSGDIYRGVQFRIGQAAYSVPDNTSNRVFYLNGNDVFLYKQYK